MNRHTHSSSTLILCLILCIAFQTWSTTAFSQRARYKPQTHELSLQLASTHGVVGEAFNTGGYPLGVEYVSGFQYTYHYSLSDGFRLGIQHRDGLFERVGPTDIPVFLDKDNWDLHLGYERKRHFGPSQIFIGADLLFSRQQIEFRSGSLDQPSTMINSKHTGIALFAGYGYFFSPYVSLSAEAKLSYLYTLSEDASKESLPISFMEQGEVGLQAVLSLNFHLIKMKKRCTCPKFR